MAKNGQNPIFTGHLIKTSRAGIDLVRLLASEGHRIFSIDLARQLGPKVGLKSSYLVEALYHLRQNGWIAPLRRGLYAISSSLPGAPPIHEFEIAMAIVSPAAISHWSALHHHGLTEQIPRSVFVLTTKGAAIPRVRERKSKPGAGYQVGESQYRFVQVTKDRFFGTEKIWVGEARVTITDRERTLVDGLTMPQYCGDLAEVLHAFEISRDRLDFPRLTDYAIRLGETTAKRLGWVLEQQNVAARLLSPLLAIPAVRYRKLDATGPARGPLNRKWMIQENLPGRLGA